MQIKGKTYIQGCQKYVDSKNIFTRAQAEDAGGFGDKKIWGRRLVINTFSMHYSFKIPQNNFCHFASKGQEDFKPNFYK